MRNYKRLRIAGAMNFFTVNLAERHGNDLLTRHIAELRHAFRKTRQDHPFQMVAAVVLPDHLHCLWQMSENDDDFSTRWRLIKARFSRSIETGERISPSRRRKGERVYGNAAIGKTPSATIWIANATWITFTTTR